MYDYQPPLRDMQFILAELAGLDDIARLPGCEEASADVIGAVLEEAGRFAAGVLAPLNRVGDEQGCRRLEDGRVATPEGWQPGDKVLVGAPVTVEDVKTRLAAGLETTDWYFSKKKLA